MSLQLDRLDHLPARLADINVRDIRQVFPNPSLIHVKGKLEPPLFISTLLHGNETTSFQVLQHLQEKYSTETPERGLMIFVGNVRASELGERHLDGEPDFNRIWGHGDTAHHNLAAEVISQARRCGLFASIDIHNNTGRNPIYGCVSSLRPEDLHLAATFAPVSVYYLNPATTQSIAFSHLCPAVTLECGKPGDPDGLKAAIDLLDYVLSTEHLPYKQPEPDALQLYETVGRVVVEPSASLSFSGNEKADLMFRDDLENLNFTHVKKGELWAHKHPDKNPMRVIDEHDADLTHEFFQDSDDKIVLQQEFVPAMITREKDIIQQDCLCYLMKPLNWSAR